MVNVSVSPDTTVGGTGYTLCLEGYALPLADAIYPTIIAKLMAAVNFLLTGGLHAECRFFHEQGDKLLVLDRKPEGVLVSVFPLRDNKQQRRPGYSQAPEYSCTLDLQDFSRALNRGLHRLLS